MFSFAGSQESFHHHKHLFSLGDLVAVGDKHFNVTRVLSKTLGGSSPLDAAQKCELNNTVTWDKSVHGKGSFSEVRGFITK